MKRGLSVAVALAALVMSFTASAAWRIWSNTPEDNHDWTNPANFADNIAPAVGDTIVVPQGLVVYLRPEDTASWNIASAETTRIQLRNSGAEVVIDVQDGSATFIGSIATAWDSQYLSNMSTGCLRKTGEGFLTLQTSNAEFGYYTGITVDAGDVQLELGSGQNIGVLTISQGSTVTIDNGSLTIAGLVGAGTIQRMDEKQDYINGNGTYEFSGLMCGNFTPWVQAKQLFTGTSSSSSPSVTVRGNTNRMLNGPYLGVARFGSADNPSSVGANQKLLVGENGGGFLYLGSGESTAKDIQLDTTTGGRAFLDGGANGGLVWNGNLLLSDWRSQNVSFVFTGDHTTPCVFGGHVFDLSWAGRSVYITKDGTGIWRFTGNKAYGNCDIAGLAVRNGVLRFDTIAEKGTNCSLGMANKTTDDFSGTDSIDSHLVPYAYILGGSGDALMEYTGNAAAKVTTRPAVLNGRGGFKSSAAAFDFTGVTAKGTDANTLILDGATVVNTIRDVTDGTGTVGIEKRGNGTWVLEGNNAFSGPVAVKAGTLRIASVSTPYRWYRFNIEEVNNGSATSFGIYYLGLFDASGNPVSDGIVKGPSLGSLQPGQAYGNYQFNVTSADTVMGGDYDKAFTWGSTLMGGYFLKSGSPWVVLKPNADDPSTWGRITFRLPDNANPATSWDFVRTAASDWRSQYMITGWSLEASVDGSSWTVVSPSQKKAVHADWNNWWASDNTTQASLGSAFVPHTTGMPIASSATTGTLPTSTEWSVDGGATLVNDNATALTVTKLDVDASKGIGTMSGFSFAADGVLTVSNHTLETAGDSVALTGDFSQSTGFANVAGWTLLVDGVESSRYGFTVSGSTITVTRVKPPFTLLLR